jgi:sugar phosphate isomerase/epimerase
MKLGVFTILFNDWSLDDTLAYVKSKGLEAVEIGTGGYSKSSHLDPEAILKNPAKVRKIKDKLEDNGLFLSALSAHGNPVHPNKEIAQRHDKEFRDTILAAEKLGMDTVLAVSGCPGGSPKDETPNWAVAAWPDDFKDVLEYQWNGVLIPYWTQMARFANDHGVTIIGIEPHPGFCVYSPETMLKLRNAAGKTIGVNLDPSHLFWQGMDPCAVIEEL